MHRSSLLASLFLTVVLSGCTDKTNLEAKIDRLQAKFDILGQILQKQDEMMRAATPSSCTLIDYERNEQVCVLACTRPFAVGDRIFIGEDMWTVQAVKLISGELPDNLRNPQIAKAYRIASIELLVKFEGKARKGKLNDTETAPK